MTDKIVVAFDLYGTLLSTESIAKQLEKHFSADTAQSISALWRRYQLEYTWRLNSMERYEDFSSITRNAFLHALAETKRQLSDSDMTSLMEAYDSLSTFPDVKPALNRIALDPTIIFRDLITVDEIKRYKPSPAAYQYLAQKVGKNASQMNEIWLISGNPFDIVGARSMGMHAIWVDRAGTGWKDAAVPDLQPTAIVHSLEHLVEKIKGRGE